MKKWGILGAMALEVERLRLAMTEVTESEIAGQKYYDGKLCGRPVTVVQCGIGKVCAAVGIQILIDRFGAELLINTGVAGGLAPTLQVGDLVVCTDAVQHDFDLTAFGCARGCMDDSNGNTAPTRYAADPRMRKLFCRTAAACFADVRTLEGTIATGDVFVDSGDLKRELRNIYGAAAAEMEGAAAAQTAVMNDVPFLIVRAISDLAEGEATKSYEEFKIEAADRVAAILTAMAKVPDEEYL